MRRTFLLLGLLLAGCSEPGDRGPDADAPAGATTPANLHVHFTTPDRPPQDSEIVRALVAAIDQARTTIDVAAFELDNAAVVEALVRAVGRNVRVRLVTESNYLDESGVKALQAVGVPVVDDRREGALMHDKFMVFDGKAVWTGSMNFTENCAYKNNNHGVHVIDDRIAASYSTKFSWMFDQRKFGGLPSKTSTIPHHQVTMSDGTPVEVWFSTHDRIAERLTGKIREAKKSVHFLAFSFTHQGMGQAMRERAAAGVEVKGVFEKSQAASSYSEFGRMQGARGCEVRIDGNPRNMHHKVIVLDDETVVAGSFNFSEGADKSNDENVLIVRNRAVAAKFEEEFQRVMTTAKRTEGPLLKIR